MLLGDLVTTMIQHVSSAFVYCVFVCVCVCTIARLTQNKKRFFGLGFKIRLKWGMIIFHFSSFHLFCLNPIMSLTWYNVLIINYLFEYVIRPLSLSYLQQACMTIIYAFFQY
jgi:hypothetical protein